MTPDEYCQGKVAPEGSSLYYSLMSLPLLQRHAIAALQAFRQEIVEVVDKCREAGVARAKLTWWREELNRLFAGWPEHPVSRALAVHLDQLSPHRDYLWDLINGAEMDLDYDAYPSFRELSLYCQRLGSSMGILATEILAYEAPRTVQFAHELGIALQLVDLLCRVRIDAQKGRFHIPEDEMQRFKVDHADLLRLHTSERVRELLKFQAERARTHYHSALGQLPEQDRYCQRSQLILGELAMYLLDEIEIDGFRILEHRIALTPLCKFWLAWRTTRRERRRYQRVRASRSKLAS